MLQAPLYLRTSRRYTNVLLLLSIIIIITLETDRQTLKEKISRSIVTRHIIKALNRNRNPLKQKASRPIVACVVTNFPAEVVEKFTCRFIQITQCFTADSTYESASGQITMRSHNKVFLFANGPSQSIWPFPIRRGQSVWLLSCWNASRSKGTGYQVVQGMMHRWVVYRRNYGGLVRPPQIHSGIGMKRINSDQAVDQL